jgi:hypothetical protein
MPKTVPNHTFRGAVYFENGFQTQQADKVLCLDEDGKLMETKNYYSSFMLQDTTRTLIDSTDEQKIFNVGSSGNGSVPIKTGKFYKFELILFLSDLVSYSKLFFSMLGNKEMTDEVSYMSMSTLIEDSNPDIPSSVYGEKSSTFDQTLINKTPDNVGDGFAVIRGSFVATGNGYIIPAISFEGMSGSDKVLKGTTFVLTEQTPTTNDIV